MNGRHRDKKLWAWFLVGALPALGYAAPRASFDGGVPGSDIADVAAIQTDMGAATRRFQKTAEDRTRREKAGRQAADSTFYAKLQAMFKAANGPITKADVTGWFIGRDVGPGGRDDAFRYLFVGLDRQLSTDDTDHGPIGSSPKPPVNEFKLQVYQARTNDDVLTAEDVYHEEVSSAFNLSEVSKPVFTKTAVKFEKTEWIEAPSQGCDWRCQRDYPFSTVTRYEVRMKLPERYLVVKITDPLAATIGGESEYAYFYKNVTPP